jgi:hypothetical protein
MSNAHLQPGGNGGFEHEDLSAKTIFGFLIGLAVLGILVYFVVNGVYWSLTRYSEAHQPRQNPLKRNVETDTRDTQPGTVTARVNRTFPEPRLETDERHEINSLREHEAEQLNSYGWVDQPAGTVHIPIERAMRLVAERGLPVRPEGAMNSAAAANTAPEKNGGTARKAPVKTR